MGKSNNDKMVEILRRIKPEMNGAAAEEMEKRGIRYGLNYGVAIPVIRRVARESAPDHALAEYLFRQDVRELKLAAVYVDDPQQVTEEQMERWTDAMPAGEIMEHAAMNLFHASPDADRIIRAWLCGDDLRRLNGALYMAGKRAQPGLENVEKYLELIENRAGMLKGDWPLRAAVYALCRMAERSPELRIKTERLIDRMSRSADRSVREIADETAALLEYAPNPDPG